MAGPLEVTVGSGRGSGGGGPSAAGAGDGAAGRARPVRTTRAVVDYSAVKRRGKRKERSAASAAYMEASGKRRAVGGALRRRIEVGEHTVDRIVGGAYEWRDGRYKVTRVIVYDDGG